MSGFADHIDAAYQGTMDSPEEIRARSCQHPMGGGEPCDEAIEHCFKCDQCGKPTCEMHSTMGTCLACVKAEMDAEDAAKW